MTNGRITPPAGTLVLDTTVNVPYDPKEIEITLSWPYPQPVGLQDVEYAGGPCTLRWDSKVKAGPQSVVLSFDRFHTTTYSQRRDHRRRRQLPAVQRLAAA